MASRITFQALPDDDVSLDQLAAALRKAGARDLQLLEGVGVITGTTTAGTLEQLSRVSGVKHVERSGDIQLPPPESDIQ